MQNQYAQNTVEPISARKNEYGLPDKMLNCNNSVKSNLIARHPVEESEKLWVENQNEMKMSLLRKTQGIHAPLKLQMEKYAASQIGRLPCLKSSNLMLDTLNGVDDIIDFDDVLNSETEVIGIPHLLIERKLGIL